MVNVAEILKQAPKGTKLWSNVFGEVEFRDIRDGLTIEICKNGVEEWFTSDGKLKYLYNVDGECVLWPSKDHRAWDDEALRILGIEKEKKPEVPFGLKPFDKVLARDLPDDYWRSDFFSFIYSGEGNPFHFICVGNQWKYCIPYNDETKHLLGTTHEPSEKYRQ